MGVLEYSKNRHLLVLHVQKQLSNFIVRNGCLACFFLFNAHQSIYSTAGSSELNTRAAATVAWA